MNEATIQVVECCGNCLSVKVQTPGQDWPACMNPECIAFGEPQASGASRKRVVADGPVPEERARHFRRMAYAEGRDGFGAGWARGANPYEGCELAAHWDDGWIEAQADSAR